jgi:hypothetical protein
MEEESGMLNGVLRSVRPIMKSHHSSVASSTFRKGCWNACLRCGMERKSASGSRVVARWKVSRATMIDLNPDSSTTSQLEAYCAAR